MSAATTVREVGMNSMGGVGVLLVRSAATGTVREIEFYGQTPSELSEDVFVPYLMDATERTAFGWRKVRDEVHERGYLSVGVPTYVKGLAALHRDHATMPWAELLSPAADLAHRGFSASDEDAFYFASHQHILTRFEEISRVYLSHGLPMPEGFYHGLGRAITPTDLGDTIRALAAEGPDLFYRGELGRRIVDDVREHGGVLSMHDLDRYQPSHGDGLRATYKGYEIVTSSGCTGGITLLEMLKLAEGLELGGRERLSGECLHLLAEVMRQAWTDRFVHVGDPDASAVPLDGLLHPDYIAETAARLPRERVPADTSPGDPWPYSSRRRRPSTPSGDASSKDTTHLAAADGDGNVVTFTQTLGLAFGSCVIPPSTGTILYDVTMWMNPEPGTPNSVGPWKQQVGHATPVMILKDGEPVAALGAPGGRRVVSAMFQTVVNMIDFGMDVQEAIGTPRLHLEGADPAAPVGPAVHDLVIDDRVPAEAIADLARRGHLVRPVFESSAQSFLAKPLGIQLAEDGLAGGVDVYRQSIGIGI
jgi:gamma-glutamyltranspeptidase / glutathione hydrolase